MRPCGCRCHAHNLRRLLKNTLFERIINTSAQSTVHHHRPTAVGQFAVLYEIHNLAGHPEMIAVETRMRGHLLDHGFQNQRSLAAEVAVPQHPYRVGGRVCAGSGMLSK
jgi:hypothetical protein